MRDYYPEISNQSRIAQLQQLTHLTWDGDLMSKDDRTQLVKDGYAVKFGNGWNIATIEGVKYLESLGFIHP